MLLVISNPLSKSPTEYVFVDLAAKNRLPGIYPSPDFVEAGGLMSYAPDFLYNWAASCHLCGTIFSKARQPR